MLGGGCARKSKRLYDWTLDIPDLDHDPPTSPPVWPKTSNKTHKILHLSDPHVQLDYAVIFFTISRKFFLRTNIIGRLFLSKFRLALLQTVEKSFAAVPKILPQKMPPKWLACLAIMLAICQKIHWI